MFFKKKSKKEKELDEAFARVEKELNESEGWEDPRRLEEYILDSCEQIITMTREISTEKNQYKIINDYLYDIRIILNMGETKRNEIKNVISKIKKLTSSKTAYQESEPRLSDDQFFLMEEHEDTILDDIHRMQENEIYQAKVESDMRFLEAEKSRWEIERADLVDTTQKCQKGSMFVFALTLTLVLAGFIYQNANSVSLMMPIMIVLFMGVLIIFSLFLYSNKKRKEARFALKELNQNISLLNIVRMKYANVTKALRYEQEMYQITTSQELHYIWEQYMLAVKEQEKFRQDNIDLEYYINKFKRLMDELELKDKKIWISQAKAIINLPEIEKIHEKLILRKNKIKDRILENTKLVKSERDEIDRLMREHNYYVPEIIEIINSVDKMCKVVQKETTEDEIEG